MHAETNTWPTGARCTSTVCPRYTMASKTSGVRRKPTSRQNRGLYMGTNGAASKVRSDGPVHGRGHGRVSESLRLLADTCGHQCSVESASICLWSFTVCAWSTACTGRVQGPWFLSRPRGPGAEGTGPSDTLGLQTLAPCFCVVGYGL